jgi:predicted esterase
MGRNFALFLMLVGFGGAILVGAAQLDWNATKARVTQVVEQVAPPEPTAIPEPTPVPPPPPPPPARFLQRDMMGMRSLMQGSQVYEPSAQITAAARLHSATIGGKERTWFALPPEASPPAGIVVALHGSARDGRSMLEMWQAAAKQNNLTIVAPNAIEENWARDDGDLALLELAAREASELYGAPVLGYFLFGHSDGAIFAQEALNKGAPGQWVAGAVHGGFTAAGKIAQAQVATPFRILLGSNDTQFFVDDARPSGTAMAQAGHPTELLVIPGHTHWFYQIGPRLTQSVWLWFAEIGAAAAR